MNKFLKKYKHKKYVFLRVSKTLKKMIKIHIIIIDVSIHNVESETKKNQNQRR